MTRKTKLINRLIVALAIYVNQIVLFTHNLIGIPSSHRESSVCPQPILGEVSLLHYRADKTNLLNF